MRILVSLVTAVLLMVGQAVAGEGPCEGKTGAAHGLCKAYCEAMKCDSVDAQASDRACTRVADNFKKDTGEVLTCEQCLLPTCIAWSCEHWDTIATWDFDSQRVYETPCDDNDVNSPSWLLIKWDTEQRLGIQWLQAFFREEGTCDAGFLGIFLDVTMYDTASDGLTKLYSDTVTVAEHEECLAVFSKLKEMF